MRVLPGLAIIIAVTSSVGFWLLSGDPAQTADAAPPDNAIPVTAGVATAQNVPIYAQGIGTVQTLNTVNVKSRVDGQVMQVFFTEGQEVPQGARLFLIDPRPFQVALDQAQ